MENQEMLQMMKKQTRYARVQCAFSVVAGVCCLALLLSLWSVLPQINMLTQEISTVAQDAQTVLSNLETVSQEIGVLAQDAQTVLSNLETVSQGLAEADLAGMVSDVDALVATSQEAVETATEKLEAMDIDQLNKAIGDLADVVEPLAKFFNAFG